MSLSGIFNLLQRYAGGGASAAAATAPEDFEKVAQNANTSHIAEGLSHAFRSDQTPAFPEMLKGLFSQSDPQQRAGLLNELLGSSSGAGGLGAIASFLPAGLSSLLQGGKQVTPEQAQQISPEAVQQLAEHAHQNNPSIVDTVSNFYSQHPGVVKTLGTGALALIMAHMYEKQRSA